MAVTTVRIESPDPPKTEELVKSINAAWMKIQQQLMGVIKDNRADRDAQVKLMQGMVNQPKALLTTFDRHMTRLVSKVQTPSQAPILSELRTLRTSLTREINRLDSAVQSQFKRIQQNGSAPAPTPKVTVRMPTQLISRLDGLEQAILKARPRTFGIMNG